MSTWLWLKFTLFTNLISFQNIYNNWFNIGSWVRVSMNLFPCWYVNNLDGFVLILIYPPSLIRLLTVTNNAWQRILQAIFFFLMQAFEGAIPHWFYAKNVHSENHQTFNLKFSPPVFTVWSWIVADFTWASLIDPDGRCWSHALVIAETQESRYNILRTVLTRLTIA